MGTNNNTTNQQTPIHQNINKYTSSYFNIQTFGKAQDQIQRSNNQFSMSKTAIRDKPSMIFGQKSIQENRFESKLRMWEKEVQ